MVAREISREDFNRGVREGEDVIHYSVICGEGAPDTGLDFKKISVKVSNEERESGLFSFWGCVEQKERYAFFEFLFHSGVICRCEPEAIEFVQTQILPFMRNYVVLEKAKIKMIYFISANGEGDNEAQAEWTRRVIRQETMRLFDHEIFHESIELQKNAVILRSQEKTLLLRLLFSRYRIEKTLYVSFYFDDDDVTDGERENFALLLNGRVTGFLFTKSEAPDSLLESIRVLVREENKRLEWIEKEKKNG